MILAINSVSEIESWVSSISPPAAMHLLVAAGLEHYHHASQQRFAHDLGVGVGRQLELDASDMRTTA